MKHLAYLFLTLLLLAGCRGDKRPFTLQAHLEGLTDSIVFAVVTDTAQARIDTIRVEQGSFAYTLPTDTVTPLTLLFADGRRYTLFADKNTESTLTGRFDDLEAAEVAGGEANEQLMAFQRTNRMTDPAALPDSIRRFIDRHPFSRVGPYLVNQYIAQVTDPDIKLIEELIGHMGGRLLDNLDVQDMQQHLEAIGKADSGKYIPSFRIKDTEEKFVSSYQYNNRYLIVGFWASWHRESVNEQKAVRRLAKSLKKEAVTFVNISLDTDKQAWRDTVKKDTLPDIQCYDLESWTAKTTTLFAVNRLPQFILLNKNKRIIARSTHLADIEERLRACIREDKNKEKNK